ncbi:MAG: RidA family protein [Rhodothermales bacterium]|nr:RidA family protein [Rhodothermales bacterium]
MRVCLLLLLLPLLAACTSIRGESDAPVFHAPEGRVGLPFSEAVRVDDWLFLSGQIGTVRLDAADLAQVRLAEGGIGPETRQTMENIRAVLERHGARLDDVVKCTVMLADIAEWPAMNAVYVTFFPGPKPARSAFAATGLALGARVEIECLAYVGD